MEKLFNYIEKCLLAVCIGGAVACLIAGFVKPHCFATAALYSIAAALLLKSVREHKED